MSVMYLFLRYKFNWNEVNFSIFNAYQMSIVLLGKILLTIINFRPSLFKLYWYSIRNNLQNSGLYLLVFNYLNKNHSS